MHEDITRDDLADLVQRAEGAEPSDCFVTEFRDRLMADEAQLEQVTSIREAVTDPPGLLDDSDPVAMQDLVFIDDAPSRTEQTVAFVGRWCAIAVAATTLVMGGVWIGSVASETGSLETLSETPAEEEPAAPADLSAPLVSGTESELEPGRHRVDVLGTEFEFELSQTTAVLRHEPGLFQIADPIAEGDRGRSITFARISHFADPADPFAPIGSQGELWPADDVFGWFDELSDTLPFLVVGPTEVGGQSASRFLVAADSDHCVGGEDCVAFATNHGQTSFTLDEGEYNGVFHLDQGDEDPIVVILSMAQENYFGWYSSVDAFLANVTLGEPQPNPLAEEAVTPPE